MSHPQLQLSTLFVLNEASRIVSVREPNGSKGPLFALVRGQGSITFACRVDVPQDVASRVQQMVAVEPCRDDGSAPMHAARYLSLCKRVTGSKLPLSSSLAIAFVAPDRVERAHDGAIKVAPIEDLEPLRRHFSRWTVGDLVERGPVVGAIEGSNAVSICYCARRSTAAAEAGVETIPGFRGRGLATQAVAAWALAVRDTGRAALYSVLVDNHASLRIAEKLSFQRYATDWSILESTLG